MKMCIILLIMVLKCQIVIIDDIGMKGNTGEEYNGSLFKENLPLNDTLSKLYGNGRGVNDTYKGNNPLGDMGPFSGSNKTPYSGNNPLGDMGPFSGSNKTPYSGNNPLSDMGPFSGGNMTPYSGNNPLDYLKNYKGVLDNSGDDKGAKPPYMGNTSLGDPGPFKTPSNSNNIPYKANTPLSDAGKPNFNKNTSKNKKPTENKPKYSPQSDDLQQIPIYSFQDIFNMKNKLNNEFSKNSNSNQKTEKDRDNSIDRANNRDRDKGNDRDESRDRDKGNEKDEGRDKERKDNASNTDGKNNSNLNILENREPSYKSKNVENGNIKPKSSNSTDNSYNHKGNNTNISVLDISDTKVVKDNDENTDLEIYKNFKKPIINTPSPIDISNEDYLGNIGNEESKPSLNKEISYNEGNGNNTGVGNSRDIRPKESNSTISYTINVNEGGSDVPKHENIPDMPSITHPYLSVDSLTPIHPYVPPSDSGSHPYLSANIDTLPNSDIFTQKKLMDKEKSNLKDANVARSSFLQLKYDESKNRLDSLKNSLNDLTSKLSILQEKMKERGMENDNLKETLRNNRNHLKNSKTNLGKIETEKHKIEAELRLDNNEIAKLNKKIDDLRNKVETLKAEQNVYRERGLTLDREVLQTDKNIKIEESKTREYKKELESLQVLLNSLNERRSELVGKMSNEESLQSKIWMEMDRIRRSELSYFY
ncbi:hypothetical protein CWI37_1016p0020 [Hamiltosporidium tvaerminnensis]|uniref:Uncharacterized protein n=1 Tax=Hamiltosporidium tvaerminnensis TaxID=1176355 RepID=A0A4Q9L070_9MICR|nr:hypothetical protein CWI37_1016p0020 [Hamiltosporidium tvaerminnensis]